ncbi:MAG: flagellar filament capping protein FliD, partial [Thermodesulfobacteriota bacterium]|nr:flagellar filament capping protein FliD [Thermodesulfobacteriota bacterium]
MSTNLISGLASGFDWRGMIDQLMAIEHQRIDLVEDRKADYESKITILQSLNTKLLSFRTKAAELAISDSFNLFKSSLTTNSSTYSASDFLTVTTNSDASPGAHTIDMDINSTIAMARKISSRSFSSYDEALNLTGEFIINSKAVNIESGDDLFDIQDKINTLNTGTNATGVTASVLTVSSTNYRLILTSDNTGKDSLSILDASADSTDILQNSSSKPGLGFFDGTTPIINNPTSDGAESNRFSSSEVAVGSLLGLTGAQTGTNITVGSSSTLDINLATDSLTTIASNINALSGVSASVESVTEEGTTSYYIDISGTTSFVDQNNVLQTLGILKGGQSDVAKVLVGEVANTEKSSGNPIDGSTTFDDITDYTSDTGDTITISGVKHDGTTVSATTFNIYDGGYKDIDALLDEIESQFGLTAGGAVMDANGKIQITDSSAGDSQLSISLVANNEGWTSGGTLDFGDITASVEGYVMELQAGQDANIIIDGTTITSSSNLIDDVITGVTLNLLTVENPSSGTKTVNLTVSRDLNSVKSSIQDLLDGYNDVITDINAQFTYDEESESAGLLQGDSTLSSIKTSLQNILVNS